MVVNMTSGTGYFPQAWHLCTLQEKGSPVSLRGYSYITQELFNQPQHFNEFFEHF